MGLDTPFKKPPDGQITTRQRELLSCPGRVQRAFTLLRRAGTHSDAKHDGPWTSSAPRRRERRAAQHPGNDWRGRSTIQHVVRSAFEMRSLHGHVQRPDHAKTVAAAVRDRVLAIARAQHVRRPVPGTATQHALVTVALEPWGS